MSEKIYLAYTGAVIVGLSTFIVKGYPKKCWDFIKETLTDNSEDPETAE